MAAVYPMETPDRVLRRVQQLEDMELPSLPSIQHDIDYESTSVSGPETSFGSDHSAVDTARQDDLATPHPLRQSYLPHTCGDTSRAETSTGSPFPPLAPNNRYETPSPYNPTSAVTSTPQTMQSKPGLRTSINESRSTMQTSITHRRATSGNSDLAASVATSRDRWHTPGEMSTSFSGEEIPVDLSAAVDQEQGDASLPSLPGTPDESMEQPQPAQTPLTRRLSSGNVVLDRRGRRSAAANSFQPGKSVNDIRIPSPIPSASEGTATPASVPFAGQDRIPSLSHTDGTDSDRSANNTPEGPVRNPHIATPRSAHGDVPVPNSARRLDWNEYTDNESTTPDHSTEEPYTTETESMMNPPSLGSLLQADIDSPAKVPQTPVYSTPGTARLDLRHRSPSVPTPRGMGPLADVTSAQNTPTQVPFTPSPAAISPKYSDINTPRAPLDDAERRKSHVLAVLNSATVPSRQYRTFQRTPHPLRRVSMATESNTISEDNASPAARLDSLQVPEISLAASGSENDSFTSIASSADLTSDKRASHKQRLSRGNTSFPNILLPTSSAAASSPGGSLRGFGEQRADGIKIHKHLNAMNKQLLEANGDLAREAEAWRGEVDRLLGILEAAGIDFETVDVDAQIHADRSSFELPEIPETSSIIMVDNSPQKSDTSTFLADRVSRAISRSRSGTPMSLAGLSPEENDAVVQEMMERLEMLEAGLDEKDAIIADLEARLEAGDASPGPDTDKLREQIDKLEQEKEALSADFASKTENHAKQFAEICVDFESKIGSLETKLKTAEGEAARLKEENETWMSRAKSPTPDGPSDQEAALQIELQRAQEECKSREENIDRLNQEIDELHEQLEITKQTASQLEDARQRVQELETRDQERSKKVNELQTDKINLQDELASQESHVQQLLGEIRQLESDIADYEADDKVAEQELSSEINRLNAVIENVNKELAAKEAELESTRARFAAEGDQAEAASSLEGHLEDAFREIGRLKQELASTPHLKSTLEIRDAKIQALEREKAALQDRVAGLAEPSTSMQSAMSPIKVTPFKHRSVTSLRMPNTPGTIPEMSWMQTTVGDANEPILRAQLEHLQTQLDDANGQLDSNFSRLESAGLNGLRLAEDLAAARQRISDLEDELLRLARESKASLADVLDRKEETEREREARHKDAMDIIRSELAKLQEELGEERKRLQKENGRLTTLVSDLRSDHAADLQAVTHEFEDRMADSDSELRRTQAELANLDRECDELKRESQDAKEHVEQLEMELSRVKADYEHAARMQQQAEHARVQREAEDTGTELASLRREMQRLESSLQAAEREASSAKRQLKDRETELQTTRGRVADLEAERQTIKKELAAFDLDLHTQRKDSQRFGVELQKLKMEQEGTEAKHAAELASAERAARSSQDRLRAAERELQSAKQAQKELAKAQSHSANTQVALDEQRFRFKAQMQELAVQIRYLKAKYTREATFRNGLSLQKRYLLLLVGGMSMTEQATLKQIAAMGYPLPPPPPRARSLKSVGLAVVSIIRARKSAVEWKAEKKTRDEAVAAREERKRIAAS